jgi:ABC-type multidrug transport system ATPase subunit
MEEICRFDALCGLNFAVPEGSAFALIGANGAGKTTTGTVCHAE